VGLDNPHSDDPEEALLPGVPGSAGHRLWQMSGIDLDVYMRVFRRVNARDNPTIEEGSRVVVLGQLAWEAMLAYRAPLFEWVDHRGSLWIKVPHPSGRNLFYNDPMNRMRTGALLRELAR
jgi:hypothetical protein